MHAIRRFSSALASPRVWANPSYLRVERRFDGRVAQPRCFIFADEYGEVTPTVYFLRTRHANIAPRIEDALKTMEYNDIDELVEDGWRPYSDADLDIGLVDANSETA